MGQPPACSRSWISPTSPSGGRPPRPPPRGALFYAFGNFCALAARPDLGSLRAMNALKGRPQDQVGSVTTTPERGGRVFDWDRCICRGARCRDDGGPARARPDRLPRAGGGHVPDASDGPDGCRTVQLISPGDACPSNALVADMLDLIGEDILYITSANASSHVSKQAEAAHYEMREIQREFGHAPGVRLIGHRNERAIRRRTRATRRAHLDRRVPHGRARARAARLARRRHDRPGGRPPRPDA